MKHLSFVLFVSVFSFFHMIGRTHCLPAVVSFSQGSIFLFFAGRIEEIKGNLDAVSTPDKTTQDGLSLCSVLIILNIDYYASPEPE